MDKRPKVFWIVILNVIITLSIGCLMYWLITKDKPVAEEVKTDHLYNKIDSLKSSIILNQKYYDSLISEYSNKTDKVISLQNELNQIKQKNNEEINDLLALADSSHILLFSRLTNR